MYNVHLSQTFMKKCIICWVPMQFIEWKYESVQKTNLTAEGAYWNWKIYLIYLFVDNMTSNLTANRPRIVWALFNRNHQLYDLSRTGTKYCIAFVLYAHLITGRIMVWAPSVNLYLVNAITCEMIDSASPNSVCGFFMGRFRTSLYLGHLDLLQGR